MKLRFTSGEHAGKVMEFSETEISIGREEGNVIQLLTGGVSRYHARIVRQEQGIWMIADLGSTNGVKIDGQPIQGERVLCAGDVVTIGEQRFEIMELEPFAKVTFQTVPGEVKENSSSSAASEPASREPENADEKKNGEKNESFSGEKLMADLKSAGSMLFNIDAAKERVRGGNDGKSSGKSEPGKEKKRFRILFNVVFYSCLVVCAVCIIRFFMNDSGTPPAGKASLVPDDVVIYFERMEYDPVKKSAFRVEVKIENGMMSCILDDVAGARHFKREIKLSGSYDNELELLVQKFERSGILKLKPADVIPADVERDRFHLIFVKNNEICDYRCSQNSSKVEFQDCYLALRDFLSGFGLSTIAQNRQDVEREAREHLRNAVDKRDNYMSNLALLRESARDFEAAISCFEQFTPAPPELKIARQGLDQVNRLRKLKLKEFQDEFKRCHRRKDYSGMAIACQEIMKVAGERSIAYREAANMLLQVRRIESGRRK